MKIISAFDRIMHKISYLLCAFCALLIFVLTMMIVIDIILRTFFSSSLIGTSTYARNMLIAIMFSGLPMITYGNGHVRSTVIVEKLNPTMQKIFDAVSFFTGFVVFLLIGIALITPTRTAIVKHYFDMELTMTLPLSPIYIISTIGSFMCAYEMLSLFVRRLLAPTTITTGGATDVG